jgi:hypothetical protein
LVFLKYAIIEFGDAKVPDVMIPKALSVVVVLLPQLYLPLPVGVPDDACWVTAVKLPTFDQVDVSAPPVGLIFQLVGRGAVAVLPIPSKFSLIVVVLGTEICPSKLGA